MKNKKIIIICLSILVIIATVFLTFVLIEDYLPKKQVKLPENESVQISTLKEIYEDFISQFENLKNSTITFEDNAFLNLVTRQKFSEKSIEELNSVVKDYNGDDSICTVSVKYSNGILELTVNEYIGVYSYNNYTGTTTYTLEFKNNKINYTRGKTMSIFNDFAPQE